MRGFIFLTLFTIAQSFGQNKTTYYYGFRHLKTTYGNDTVDILIKSKKGDENKKKPIFLFCQGSNPIPLIIFDNEGPYGVFPFSPDILTNNYHLVIVGKPYVPLISERNNLKENFIYTDSSGKPPIEYLSRNYLDYYVKRNIHVINFLQTQSFISKTKLIVAGHSEGSHIVAKLAVEFPKITHVIYSGGNPLGRIMSILKHDREIESDSIHSGEEQIKYWTEIVNNPNIDRATYSFSYPPIEYLKQIKKPVYVCYGTKDDGTLFNDYMRIEFIRENKKNVTFKTYIGTEHNYFMVGPSGKINYDKFNWDNVVKDWVNWLDKN